MYLVPPVYTSEEVEYKIKLEYSCGNGNVVQKNTEDKTDHIQDMGAH